MKKLDIYLQNVRIGKAVDFIKPGDNILDIGSGDAPLFLCLINKGVKFKGVGFDPDVKEVIRAENYIIYNEMFPNDAIRGNSFNIITALAVLEHIPKEQLEIFVDNCYSQLEPGGLMVLTVPSKEVDFILKILIGLRILHGMEVEQHYGYDTGRTIPLFTGIGFELVKHKKFQLGLNNLFVFRKKVK